VSGGRKETHGLESLEKQKRGMKKKNRPGDSVKVQAKPPRAHKPTNDQKSSREKGKEKSLEREPTSTPVQEGTAQQLEWRKADATRHPT